MVVGGYDRFLYFRGNGCVLKISTVNGGQGLGIVKLMTLFYSYIASSPCPVKYAL